MGLAYKQSNINILLGIDNTTAIAYVNRMGGTQFPELNSLARQIWQWAETRKIFLVASYVKSEDNIEADYLFRLTNSDTEWTISQRAFENLTSHLGFPEIDLFATAEDRKCQKLISRFPERGAIEIDAFTLP